MPPDADVYFYQRPCQGHKVKQGKPHGKVLSEGIIMWNIEPLALTIQKLLAR